MKRLVITTLIAILLISAITIPAYADKPTKFDSQGNETGWENNNCDCTRIQEGILTYSAGHYLGGQPLQVGYDIFGYNYQGHMFKGSYFNAYAGGAGFPPYEGDDEAYQKSSCTVILERVLKLVSYRIEKQGVRITCHTADGTPEIWMKPNSIQQVLLNLTTNALDALEGSEKKEVHVSVDEADGMVSISVKDNGPGIPPEEQGKLFAGFHQVDPSFTGQIEGWGLGLPFVKKGVDQHKGRLVLQSAIGKGTTVTVSLPAASP